MKRRRGSLPVIPEAFQSAARRRAAGHVCERQSVPASERPLANGASARTIKSASPMALAPVARQTLHGKHEAVRGIHAARAAIKVSRDRVNKCDGRRDDDR